MNEPNQTPPNPPMIPPTVPVNPPPVIGADDHKPIQNIASLLECVLRQPGRIMVQLREPHGSQLIFWMLLVSAVCSLIYGVVVGSFSGGVQWWASPVKITIGLLISMLICLPSLYIFASLGRAQIRLIEVFGLLAGLLMLMTLLLVGFAPVAWIFSQSTESLGWMGFLHIAFWLVSTAFGLRFLHAGLEHAQSKSYLGFQVWTLIFVLVMLQMTTALRPIIGTSDTFLPKQKKFFLNHWEEYMNDHEQKKPAAPTD